MGRLCAAPDPATDLEVYLSVRLLAPEEEGAQAEQEREDLKTGGLNMVFFPYQENLKQPIVAIDYCGVGASMYFMLHPQQTKLNNFHKEE